MLNELYHDVEYKTLLKHISSQYKGKVVLDRKQTAGVLGIGVSTLDLRISQGRIFLATLKWEIQRILA